MDKYPDVRLEDGLSLVQWEKQRQDIQRPANWGSDLDIRLMAIYLGKDIIVLTGNATGHTMKSARLFLHELPPLPGMDGGIFRSLSLDTL